MGTVIQKCSPRFKEQLLLFTVALSHNICKFWKSLVVSVMFRTHFITTVTMKISPFPLKASALLWGCNEEKKGFQFKSVLLRAELTVFQFYFLKWTPSVFMVIHYNQFLRCRTYEQAYTVNLTDWLTWLTDVSNRMIYTWILFIRYIMAHILR